MRAGLQKILVRRETGEKKTESGLVVPVGVVKGKNEEVVWGRIEDMGVGGKTGHSFGMGMAAYDIRNAVVVEKGDGYVLEVIAEEDVLAFDPKPRPAVDASEPGEKSEEGKPEEVKLEETTEGPVTE
jgi:co-chaperonin GroES (HSP10)